MDVPVLGIFAMRYEPLGEIDLANPLFTKELAGQYSKGKVYVRYSKKRIGTALENSIVKPFIVVEGYDIHDVAPLLQKENYDINKLIGEWDKLQGYDFNGALDDDAGYDLIFVDYYTMDAIENNAKMLEAVIDEINLRKVNNAVGVREKNVVMGISMGGLVSRYCLAKMTKTRGTNSTDTRMLLTMDSPHQGANIPLGFQHFIYDFGEVSVSGIKFKKLNDQLKQFYELQSKPATAQQLIARVTGAGDPVSFNTFLEGDYRNAITFSVSDAIPSYSFKAVSQGSACAQWVMQPGTNLVDVVDNKMVSLNIILWGLFKGKYRLDLKINALPAYGSSNIICDLKVERNVKLFWGLIGTGWVQTSDASPRHSPPNMIPWDCVLGSTQSASGRSGGFSQSGTVGPFGGNFKDRTVWGFGLELLQRPFVSITQSIDIPFNQDVFSFVPITSALDIQNPGLASFYQTHVFPVDGLGNSTSSGYIAQKKFTGTINDQSATLYNNTHTDFTARNALWIYNEMQEENQVYDCEDYCESNMSITGDGNFCTLSNNYSVSNLFPGSVVEWQVSPPNIATPNNPGAPETTLMKTGNGTITLKAIVTNACMVSASVIEKQNIQVGVPERPILREEMGNKLTSISTCFGVHRTLCPKVDFPGEILEWEWEKVTGNFNLIDLGNCADVLGYSAGTGIVSVRVRNACGWSKLSLFSVNITDCMMKTQYQIKLSPNPAVSIVTLMVNTREENKNLPEASINDVRIYDSFGNLKINKKFAKLQSATIQVDGLKTGVYIIEINTGNGIEHQQLIIHK